MISLPFNNLSLAMRPFPCSNHLLKWIKAHLFFILVFGLVFGLVLVFGMVFLISIRLIIPNFNSSNIFRISFSVIVEFIRGIHKLGWFIAIVDCCVLDYFYFIDLLICLFFIHFYFYFILFLFLFFWLVTHSEKKIEKIFVFFLIHILILCEWF